MGFGAAGEDVPIESREAGDCSTRAFTEANTATAWRNFQVRWSWSSREQERKRKRNDLSTAISTRSNDPQYRKASPARTQNTKFKKWKQIKNTNSNVMVSSPNTTMLRLRGVVQSSFWLYRDSSSMTTALIQFRTVSEKDVKVKAINPEYSSIKQNETKHSYVSDIASNIRLPHVVQYALGSSLFGLPTQPEHYGNPTWCSS